MAPERDYRRASFTVRAGIVIFRNLNRLLDRFPRATTAAIVLVPVVGFVALLADLVRRMAG